jgi:putative DNA primase/helicase
MTFSRKRLRKAARRGALRDAAQRYAALGIPVLPMYSVTNGNCDCGKADCPHSGKHPRVMGGWKKATTDRDQIDRWWHKHPNANIGLLMGSDANIVCLDVDKKHGGLKTLKRLKRELGPLPFTPKVRSGGGGLHYFFRYPDRPVRRDTRGSIFGPGVDLLAEKSLVIAPSSAHISGQLYKWFKGRRLDSIERAPLPQAWLDRIDQRPAVELAPNSSTAPMIPEGERNAEMTSLAGTMHRRNMGDEAIVAALDVVNQQRCNPPLELLEIKAIVASVTRYAPGPLQDGEDSAEQVMHVMLARHFAGGEHLMFGIDGQFWSYDGRKWAPITQDWLKRCIYETVKSCPRRPGQNADSLIRQTASLVRTKLAINDDRLRFTAEPLPVINCRNGELWILEDGRVELREHRPSSYLRHSLELEYNPKARCPRYDAAVLAIFAKASDPEAMVALWNDLVGHAIRPDRSIPLILILLGSGRNGKSMLVQTLFQLLGDELVCATRIEDLDKSRFAIGNLLGKRVLIDDDVRAGIRLPDGELKKISEAKLVTGEPKYGKPFNFVVRTLPILLCNNVPSLADLSRGMQDRLMVIPFDRTFTETERDPTLFPTIWKEEMSGVLNRALEGLRQLVQRRNRFEQPEDVVSAKQRLLVHANPLPAFLKEGCVKDPARSCLMRDFYLAYRRWAEQSGITLTQQQSKVRTNLEHFDFKMKRSNKGLKIVGLALRWS